MGQAVPANSIQSIIASWSLSAMTPGVSNRGTLSIASAQPGGSVSLSKNEYVTIQINQSGWTIAATDTSNWKVTSGSFGRGGTQFYLEMLTTPAPPDENNGEDKQENLFLDLQSAEPITVGLTITPPDASPVLKVGVELLDSTKSQLSYITQVTFNYLAPGVPLLAFSVNPTVALLTTPADTEFSNSLKCELYNNYGKAITAATLTLQLQAFDSSGHPVSITQSLAATSVGGNLDWTFSSVSEQWSATISTSLGSADQLDVDITNFVLNESGIAEVKAVFTVSGIGTVQEYQTTAVFEAYGPYTLTLALDSTDPNAKFYQFSGTGAGPYDINPLNSTLDQPPLLPELTDSTNTVIYPPVPGWFSWDKTKPYFPSGHTLPEGQSSPVYYLVSTPNGGYTPLTTATADLSFMPQTLQAAGYDQAYTNASGQVFGPVMPQGAIIMWSGTQIPDGWALCDGTTPPGQNAATPNLVDKFIMGASVSTVNHSGDGDSHSHTSGAITTTTNGAHTHSMPSSWYNRSLSTGKYTGIDVDAKTISSVATSSDGDHTHTVTIASGDLSTQGPLKPSWFQLCFIIKL